MGTQQLCSLKSVFLDICVSVFFILKTYLAQSREFTVHLDLDLVRELVHGNFKWRLDNYY